MKIYITGIAGLLGYNIANELKGRSKITGIDIVNLDAAPFEYMKGSLLESDLVKKHIKTEKPNVLIHTAAMVNVDQCEVEESRAVRFNYNVTEDLTNICAEQNIKLVYISTDAVFDGNKEELYTENDLTNPCNVYGMTKLDGERCVLNYEKNLVLRTNIYGRNIQNKMSFGEWIYCGLKNGETLNMFTDVDFSPILVNDLAEIIFASCKKGLTGLYHACGTGSITKYDFAVKLKEIFSIETGRILPAISDSANFRAERAKHMGMSNQKLSDALNIRIRTPEESIIRFRKIMEDVRYEDKNRG